MKDHINYFNIESLRRLLKKVGFEIIHSEVIFLMEFFTLMGDDYVNDPNKGRISHLRRVNFKLNLTKSGIELK